MIKKIFKKKVNIGYPVLEPVPIYKKTNTTGSGSDAYIPRTVGFDSGIESINFGLVAAFG